MMILKSFILWTKETIETQNIFCMKSRNIWTGKVCKNLDHAATTFNRFNRILPLLLIFVQMFPLVSLDSLDCIVFGKDSVHLPEQFLCYLALDKILWWAIINGSCFESCLKFEVSLVRRKAFLSLDWLQGYSCTIVQGGSLKCPLWGVPHISKFFKMDNWTSSASALNNIGRRNNYVSLKFE